MAKLPVVGWKETVRALKKAGFAVVRQRGSHVILKRQGYAFLVAVLCHPGDLATGTLRQIVSDSGLTVDEFAALL